MRIFVKEINYGAGRYKLQRNEETGNTFLITTENYKYQLVKDGANPSDEEFLEMVRESYSFLRLNEMYSVVLCGKEKY